MWTRSTVTAVWVTWVPTDSIAASTRASRLRRPSRTAITMTMSNARSTLRIIFIAFIGHTPYRTRHSPMTVFIQFRNHSHWATERKQPIIATEQTHPLFAVDGGAGSGHIITFLSANHSLSGRLPVAVSTVFGERTYSLVR